MKTVFFPIAHGIRGIAALIVVIAHSKFFFWVGGSEYLKQNPISEWKALNYLTFGLDMFTSNASAMVIIFFVLSGFFIAFSLEKNTWSLVEFYKIRFIRVYIPFLASLCLATSIFYFFYYRQGILIPLASKREINDLIKNTDHSFNVRTLLSTLFFIRNDKGVYMSMNYPYWSLFHEMLFYIIAPVMVRHIKQFFFVSGILFLLVLFVPVGENMLLRFICMMSFFFALGVYSFKRMKNKPLAGTSIKYFWLVNLFVFGLVLASEKVIGKQLNFLLASVWTIFTISRIVHFGAPPSYLTNVVKYIGKVSYTLYLFHVPVYMFFLWLLLHYFKEFNFYSRWYWLAAVAAFIFSIPIYYLIEHKSMKLIKRLKEGRAILFAQAK